MSATSASTDPRDGLLAGIDDLLTPWLIWAGHFAFSYVWLAVRCVAAPSAVPGCRGSLRVRRDAARAGASGLDRFWPARLAHLRQLAKTPALAAASAGTRCQLRLGSTLLALLASVWTVLPMGLVHGCGP